jgi:3-oxoacyl-[acyl-carrier-protein] synthase II
MIRRRVAITGMGMVAPLGIGVEKNWEAMLAGESGVAEVTRFDASRLLSRIAGEVKDFRPPDFIKPDDLDGMSLSIQFALAAASEALADAEISASSDGAGERIGVNVGVGLGLQGCPDALKSAADRKGGSVYGPGFIPNLMGHMAASNVAERWNFRGPLEATSTACASGTHAIGLAYHCVQRGDADVMVAGGTEACIFELTMGGFCAMRLLSARNDAPKEASRPFDAGRDGFVIGEGAGIVILEDLEKAEARGAKIWAEVKGFGLSANTHHFIQPDPDGEGPILAMEMALRDAGVPPEEVDYINAHGTATGPNDKIETLAIKRVFGEHAYRIGVSSTKSMTGHLLGAAGAVESIYTVLALHRQIHPPTINYCDPDPDCDLDYVPNESRKARVRNAINNSFGFGGPNASLLFSLPPRSAEAQSRE